MFYGQMPHLTPALQPPSVSHWQKATAVTGPWRSCCTPVVREWGTQWAGSDHTVGRLRGHLSSIFQADFWSPSQMDQVICKSGLGGVGRLDLQGPPWTVGPGS